MADDASSVPGSLFGNLPINQGATSEQRPGPGAGSALDDDAQSYVDFYARLGGAQQQMIGRSSGSETATTLSRRLADDDLEASLLGGGSEAASSSRFDLLSPTSTWFAKHRKRVNLLVIGSVVVMIIVMLWWVTGGGRTVEPPLWEPASSYQVSFVMTLASGLEEPGVAMVDLKAKAMRVSYYSGMTTFIINETGPSYSIVPRIDKLTCFMESGGVQLQSVFPDMKRFKYVRQRDLILVPRGAKAVTSSSDSSSSKGKRKKQQTTTCEEWTYKPEGQHGDDNYIGTYTLWTLPGVDGVPVRFSFVGHNVILGSSHYDNYTIDYFNYRDLAAGEGGIDPFWLHPPRGMPCLNVTDSGGPTRVSEHVRSVSMLFPESQQQREDAYDQFHKLMSQKEKSAGRSVVFHQTLRLVEAHNRDVTRSYTLGLNFMADWTIEERERFVRKGLRQQMLESDEPVASVCKVEPLADLVAEAGENKLPSVVDHIKAGLTLPPGEQGTCGSCWAFAATGAVEGQIARHTGKPPVGLSEQNLMDCSWEAPYSNAACNGGFDYAAYGWAMKNNQGQIATEESYPFLNQDGFCHYDLLRKLVSDGAHPLEGAPPITDCFHVTEAFKDDEKTPARNPDEQILALNLRLASEGPLSVAIDASPHDFYFYRGGVYNNPDCKGHAMFLDHAVLAVGYNLSAPIPFTVVRNNWGLFWGEKGYARIAQKGNICGVATAATYVALDGDTLHPTHEPTARPTTLAPSTLAPSRSPTVPQTGAPVTAQPSQSPSKRPTLKPTLQPSARPTDSPEPPLPVPTLFPTRSPTKQPTASPTHKSTSAPTLSPTRYVAPSNAPTHKPTLLPTMATGSPTVPPTEPPTATPTVPPTEPQTPAPTEPPTAAPTAQPSEPPTAPPTTTPTAPPTAPPTEPPTAAPTTPPTEPPTAAPTTPPTEPPTTLPTAPPTAPPTTPPTTQPTETPSAPPTAPPTAPTTTPPSEPPSAPPST